MFRLDKRKIFLLYHYYLVGNFFNNKSGDYIDEKEQKRFFWLKDCLKNKDFLQEKISKKLKTSWEFSRLPPLEKAILTYATYELFSAQDFNQVKMLIDQTINFSKVYLEENKYKYINKILDLLFKEKNTDELKKV